MPCIQITIDRTEGLKTEQLKILGHTYSSQWMSVWRSGAEEVDIE